jgi:hypothetical protein
MNDLAEVASELGREPVQVICPIDAVDAARAGTRAVEPVRRAGHSVRKPTRPFVSTHCRSYDGVLATRDDVRRIVLSLPETTEDPVGFRFFVDGKQFVWTWNERVHPRRARVPNPDVVAIRVADESEKEVLIEMDPDVFFTEPHYDGYPAILVRLPAIDLDLLEVVLSDGWRSRAPKRLLGALSGRSAPI